MSALSTDRTTVPKRKTPRRESAGPLRYALLCLVLVVSLAPIIWPVMTSFKAVTEQVFGPSATLIPRAFSLDSYRTLFAQVPIWQYVRNSLFYCALAVISQVVLASTCGYMLSRKHWRGRWLTNLLITITLIFPFEAIMLSLYTQVRAMGLLDSVIGVWLPGMISAFNILVMRASFVSVPTALEESALMDGAGEFRRFWSIYLPSAKGALTIVALTAAVGAWDDFLWPLIVLRSDTNFTLPVGLATLQSSFGFDVKVVLAGAVVALVPVVALFFALQRFFFRGVESGGVK
ncbi:carbohydrate ABC transporter permease [Flexivirga meconopsidis]|uniref:carbohydrate ABC transporter permease n=1 Tax=Flexivirga meconopsidis TaxID=2977121 RepID=UPI00223F409A|nr:carbohydrate ABC transporter permease [Flexivirga meconopsidis]